ncbi:MAG: magnesium-translocating P-type ATPase [Anaerolineaceae bacterium]|nr:magnesium-translocating P-type ATPase [Anaerolineaceae bacterium]
MFKFLEKNPKAVSKEAAERGKNAKMMKKIAKYASYDASTLYAIFSSSAHGMDEEAIDDSRDEFGKNVMDRGKKVSVFKRVWDSFINPFTLVLLSLAVVSAFTDIIFAPSGEKNFATVIIIVTMVIISGVLRFVQETRSGDAAEKLLDMITNTAAVERVEDGKKEIPIDEIVCGDIIWLSAGDMVPADVRILEAKDLFISQSSLTGESEPVEKFAECENNKVQTTDLPNIAFMGSTVISGSAKAIVIAVGNNTMLGTMAKELNTEPVQTSFDKGVNAVSWVLIRFMLVMVPVVLFVNGFTKHDWMQAVLFALSIAVGLTPEMLPMIVTTALARGSVAMSHKKVIIKNLNAIQNLGSMDILCTDKTGTLTQDRVVLEVHLDLHGKEDDRVLRHAFLNSYFQTGLKNLIDIAIIEKQDDKGSDLIRDNYSKVDEIPFDFERRRMSVVVADKTGKTQMITKGAIEEMLNCCSYAEIDGEVVPLSDEVKNFVINTSDGLNEKGMRVIAVAHKTNPSPVGKFSVSDESEMVLIGLLGFLDPPKETTAEAIQALKEHGITVKILTGDNEKVACAICRQVGLDVSRTLLGSDIDAMSDEELLKAAEEITVFAKLSPSQKSRVVTLLRDAGHTVGYMGDGINDAAAMTVADVGISVDTAVDIAKEAANVVLLEKDLNVINDGVIEGRKTYANMIKYIKLTASSNFGNMFSVLAASAFLPFLPMASLQLLLLNLIYDISCTSIPWDNVDEEFLKKPRSWDASSISRFMLIIGPTSSVFDIITYIVMYFVICPLFTGGKLYTALSDPAARALFVAAFQTGWFIETIWTQSLVIHMIRTEKIPFIQSHASATVTILSFLGAAVATIIPYSPLADPFGMVALPAVYFKWLALIVAGYMLLVFIVKKLYIKKYGELL